MTGGTAPITFSETGTLPAGLSLNNSTGAITGTLPEGALSARPYAVTVVALDPWGATASVSFDWTVSQAPIAVSPVAVEETAGVVLDPSHGSGSQRLRSLSSFRNAR